MPQETNSKADKAPLAGLVFIVIFFIVFVCFLFYKKPERGPGECKHVPLKGTVCKRPFFPESYWKNLREELGKKLREKFKFEEYRFAEGSENETECSACPNWILNFFQLFFLKSDRNYYHTISKPEGTLLLRPNPGFGGFVFIYKQFVQMNPPNPSEAFFASFSIKVNSVLSVPPNVSLVIPNEFENGGNESLISIDIEKKICNREIALLSIVFPIIDIYIYGVRFNGSLRNEDGMIQRKVSILANMRDTKGVEELQDRFVAFNEQRKIICWCLRVTYDSESISENCAAEYQWSPFLWNLAKNYDFCWDEKHYPSSVDSPESADIKMFLEKDI